MENHKTIEKHIIEKEAFQEKDPRVLITSGESLTPYFVNAEKLCGDAHISQFLKENENNGKAIIEHSIMLMQKNKDFREDIEIIAVKVKELLQKGTKEDKRAELAVSGGMRRDLIFSGPIAKILDLPHIILYKQDISQPTFQDRIEVYWPNSRGLETKKPEETLPFYTVHISDLLTKGSSQYSKSPKTGRALGWVPMLRTRGATINDLVVVVSRLQGGEEKLNQLREPITTHSFVEINEEFLRTHSKNPEAAINYSKDETESTKEYLKKTGIGLLVPYFRQKGKSLTRAKRFLIKYKTFLEETGLMKSLEESVEKTYNMTLNEIIGE
ncbi:hypothetical protein DRJ25_04620 [Candidatus Woesearchaeota archaeon]|nr:MAG: hypothetical protein DRJ25_04620 [Candidatus Woesearchaeota archaeon]